MQIVLRDWGGAIWSLLAEEMAMFLAAIPKIIWFVLILIAGWLIATLVEKGGAALLRSAKFNDLVTRSGFGDFVRKKGVKTNSVGLFALIVLVAAFNAFGFPVLSDILNQLLLWQPNILAALVILVFGGLAADALSSLVREAASSAELGNPKLEGEITNVIVWAFAIAIAINQIGIAVTLLNTLFIGTVGATSMAIGVAFRYGGRETAIEIVRGWYETGKQAIPKMHEIAQDVQEQSQQQTRQRMPPPR